MGVSSPSPAKGRPLPNYEKVFEEAPDAMLVVDDERAFLAGNRRARDLLGVTPPQLLRMRVDDIAPEGLEARWAAFRRDGRQEGSLIVRSRDGNEQEVELKARADLDPGQHLAVLCPVAAPRARRGGRLSVREREVVRMLASGRNANEIAAALFLSRATVATHVRNAMAKLGARTRVEAVVIALRDGEVAL